MSNLTEQQRTAVESSADAVLVLASAGSGKTHVLTERVRYLLGTEKRAHILALTFTNKAAEEMQVRIANSVPNASSRTFIGTFHRFCLDLIRSKGHLIGYYEMPQIFERDEDRKELLSQAMSNCNMQSDQQKYQKEHERCIGETLRKIEKDKKYLRFSNDKVAQEYNELLASQNAIDYDDIILLAYKILVDYPIIADTLRKQYKYILVDEAQDLNFAQYEFLKVLCGETHKRVMMVGDPNQAIYGFNGSDRKYMTDFFVRDFSPVTEIRLTENFRSTRKIIQAANCLLGEQQNLSVVCPLIGEFEIKPCHNQQEEAKWIVDRIQRLMQNGHSDILGDITGDKIAVLARTKYVFHELEKILNQKEIAYFIKKSYDNSTFESDFVKVFDLGLQLLGNPKDQLHYQQLLMLLQCSNYGDEFDSPFLHRLQILESQVPKESRHIFEMLKKSWTAIDNNIHCLKSQLEEMQDFLRTIIDQQPDITAIEDILEYQKLWDKYCRQFSRDQRTISHFRSQIALGITNTAQTQSGITLGTVHSVKGLGFDVVFIMGMNERTFPDYRSVNNPEALAEEKNNAYVAFTRAKRLLFVTYPESKLMPWNDNMPQQPSRFLNFWRNR